MIWVVTYDISDDRTRGRAADELGAYGVRVQESVFECRLDDGLLGELVERLEGLSLETPDGFLLYRVCRDCSGASLRIGTKEETRWHVT